MDHQLTFAFDAPAPARGIPIKELPATEQPSARLHHYGPSALSTPELLAIIAAVPYQSDATALLHRYGSLGQITNAPINELAGLDGIGPAAATRLRAALELARRLNNERAADLPQIRSPADAAALLLAEMSTLEKEHLIVLLLDTKNRVTARRTVYIGSLNTSLIRVGEVYRDAIRANAASIIVAHNHPSGDPTPSPEDVAVTNQIREAGRLLDIELLDHIIIGLNRFVSLKERGLGFSL